MDHTLPGPRLDRRAVIAWTGATAAALAVSGVVVAFDHAHPPPAEGYGVDPDLMAGKTPWPRTFTPDQQRAAAALADAILPAEGPAPSASALGVHQLIDEWVSAPYPAFQADRALILPGLAWLDMAARRAGGQPFAAASDQVREAVLAQAASDAPKGFYARFRAIVIGAYYTTEAGFKDIGYIGNQALGAFPPASDEIKAALEGAYQTQGLPKRSTPWS